MEQKELLQRAFEEINSLRRQNELITARLEVFDMMMRLFHTIPNFGGGGVMHPDIAWEINKYLKNISDNVAN